MSDLTYLGHAGYSDGPVPISGDGLLIPTQATLDTEGLPQSATGQATILTGINCARLLGHHKPAFPNEVLRQVIKEKSILKQVRDMGFRPAFINAYRPLFFTLKESTRWRLSTTTVANLAADLPFFRIEDLVRKKALYHELTNTALIEKGFSVPRFTPEEAADIASGALNDYQLILYEHFLTDRAGHSGRMDRALQILRILDRFIAAILARVDLRSTLIMVTSDHGNVEDLSVDTHTRNPAMTLIWGHDKEEVAGRIRSLEHITPALTAWLQNAAKPEGEDT
jgi:hypothetical protein